MGLCAGALRMFLGTSDSGGECNTSIYQAVSCRNPSKLEYIPMTLHRRGSDERRVHWRGSGACIFCSGKLVTFVYDEISWSNPPWPLIV